MKMQSKQNQSPLFRHRRLDSVRLVERAERAKAHLLDPVYPGTNKGNPHTSYVSSV